MTKQTKTLTERNERLYWSLLGVWLLLSWTGSIQLLRTLPTADFITQQWLPVLPALSLGGVLALTAFLGERFLPNRLYRRTLPFMLVSVLLAVPPMLATIGILLRANLLDGEQPRERRATYTSQRSPWYSAKQSDRLGILTLEDGTTIEILQSRLRTLQIQQGERALLTWYRGRFWDWGSVRPATAPPR